MCFFNPISFGVCHVSIQLDGNHVAFRPELRHRHKNTWISSVGVRDLRAEILLAKVQKLAIQQQIATYEVKANINTWYRESKLHMAYGGTIGLVVICIVVLMCLVCYCNHKVKKNASGVVINQVTMDETPTRKFKGKCCSPKKTPKPAMIRLRSQSRGKNQQPH